MAMRFNFSVMTNADPLIPRLYKVSTLLVALSSTACASTHEYDQAARHAARACNVSEGNLVLTSDRGVDQRRVWLVARRGVLTPAQFDCIDKWSVTNFTVHAELASSLPPRWPSKAEIEQQSDLLADQTVAERVSPHP
jgi:hypothetical protein